MKTVINKRGMLAAIGSVSLLALSACAEEDTEEAVTAGEPGTQSIAALIAGDDELSGVEELITDAGLSGAFDAAPHYTVFAPTDAALEELGDDFTGDEGRAAMAAVLREHVVPGYLTTEDIANAVEAAGGPVEMATMGSGTLTFSMDDDALTVRGSESGDAVPIGDAMLGNNGVVVPVGAVLKDIQPAG